MPVGFDPRPEPVTVEEAEQRGYQVVEDWLFSEYGWARTTPEAFRMQSGGIFGRIFAPDGMDLNYAFEHGAYLFAEHIMVDPDGNESRHLDRLQLAVIGARSGAYGINTCMVTTDASPCGEVCRPVLIKLCKPKRPYIYDARTRG